MDFATTLRQVLAGKHIHRGVWARDTYVALMPGYTEVYPNATTRSVHQLPQDATVSIAPYFVIRRHDGMLSPWSPNNADLLANDWTVLDAEETPAGNKFSVTVDGEYFFTEQRLRELLELCWNDSRQLSPMGPDVWIDEVVFGTKPEDKATKQLRLLNDELRKQPKVISEDL